MIHLKKFWINLIFYKDWIWKIKDYNRLQDCYQQLIHKKTKQSQHKVNFYKLEILDLIDEGKTIEEIKKYLLK